MKQHLTPVIAFVVFAALGAFLYWTIATDIERFDPFIVASLQSCKAATTLLGPNIRIEAHSDMEWETAAGAGAASGTFQLKGDKGQGNANATLEQHANNWSVTSFQLDQEGRTTDLLICFR